MSDDPTRPVPSGWPEQPPRYSPPGGRGPQDPYGPGGPDGYPGGQAGRGRHSGGYQDQRDGYQDNRGGYQNDQGSYRDDRGRDGQGNYAGEWGRTPQPPARPSQSTDWSGWEQGGGERPRKRHRGLKILAIVVVVLLVLAVIIDRVAVKLAENEVADQIKSAGFPVKPSVSIDGFPFLTQVAEKNFHQIDISASNVQGRRAGDRQRQGHHARRARQLELQRRHRGPDQRHRAGHVRRTEQARPGSATGSSCPTRVTTSSRPR